ncbi:MAG: hypothetical protein Q9221_001793 [Calogaya cf. arnoldii]
MASPYQHYDDEFCKAEWRVNAIWNAILTTTFPHGINLENWVVAPEAYPTWDETPSLAADLCVAELVGDPDKGVFETSTPVLTYEGKGGNSQRSWPQIQQQILDWCLRGVQNGSPFNAPFCCWAIGAMGKYAQSYVFNGANIYPVGVGADATNNPVVRRMISNPQDITEAAGWANVAFILGVARNNPFLTAQEIANM